MSRRTGVVVTITMGLGSGACHDSRVNGRARRQVGNTWTLVVHEGSADEGSTEHLYIEIYAFLFECKLCLFRVGVQAESYESDKNESSKVKGTKVKRNGKQMGQPSRPD
jgi:hypothetical protein